MSRPARISRSGPFLSRLPSFDSMPSCRYDGLQQGDSVDYIEMLNSVRLEDEPEVVGGEVATETLESLLFDILIPSAMKSCDVEFDDTLKGLVDTTWYAPHYQNLKKQIELELPIVKKELVVSQQHLGELEKRSKKNGRDYLLVNEAKQDVREHEIQKTKTELALKYIQFVPTAAAEPTRENIIKALYYILRTDLHNPRHNGYELATAFV